MREARRAAGRESSDGRPTPKSLHRCSLPCCLRPSAGDGDGQPCGQGGVGPDKRLLDANGFFSLCEFVIEDVAQSSFPWRSISCEVGSNFWADSKFVRVRSTVPASLTPLVI